VSSLGRLIDAVLGRTKPVKSQLEKLFAMSTAYVTLTVDQGEKPTGRAGICFRPVTSSRFSSAEGELDDLLKVSGKDTGTRITTTSDPYGFQWVVFEDAEFENLVATVHLVSLTLQDSGFGEQLLAAVFKFEGQGFPIYWVYNYKRGSFYPFVPVGNRRRDNAVELRLAAVMDHELPMEKEYERWFPVWGIPV
jgi:hypothetical protein